MKSLLDMFVTECEYKNLSPLTVKTYKPDIGYLIEFLEASALVIRSVKSFLAWVYSEEYITKDLSSQFKKIKLPNKIIPTFDFDVIKDWLEVFDLETFTGHRNYVIMCTLLDCGLRISELINLKVYDINMKEGYLLVTGKGSKIFKEGFGQFSKTTWTR